MIIAAFRSSLHTRRAHILLRAGVIRRLRAPTLLRPAVATEAEATLARRAVTAEVVALPAVMEAEAVRVAMVVEAPAAVLTPVEAIVEVEATRAVEEAVTPVAAEGARTAVVADIRIANSRFRTKPELQSLRLQLKSPSGDSGRAFAIFSVSNALRVQADL